MIDHTYLQKGLLATARSHQAGSMAGHLGASVLAGYYLGEDYPDLPKAVMEGIQGELQRIIQGEEALWTSIGKTGIGARELFAEAGDGELLRSPQGDPELAAQKIVHGLKRLMQQFDQAAPGRGYFGKAQGWLTGNQITLDASQKRTPFISMDQAMHGFYQLRESLNEDRLRQACDDAFLYLMA